MATNASIKVLKSMPFKGGTRVYSNRYHFNGGTPADSTHWTTLSDAIVTAEKAIHAPSVTIVGTVGYGAGSDVPVFSKTYTTVGTVGAGGSAQFATGEVAALVRWSTAARSTKNHPIYLFKYYHHVYMSSGGSTGVDTLDTTQKAAMETYAGAWITGFSDGTHTCVLASPRGDAATGHQTEALLTHRDFPYTRSL